MAGTTFFTFKIDGKVKRTFIAPFVKLQLKALRYGSHRVAPANYTIPASTLQMAPPERQTSDSARYLFIDPGRMKGGVGLVG